MHVGRVRFWILAILLFIYLAGVLLLSAVTLHEPRNGGGAGSGTFRGDRNYPQNGRLKSYDGMFGLRPLSRRSKIKWCSQLKYLEVPRVPVALVSFPGSGNTWLRYLLQQATGFYTGSVYKDYGLLKNGFPAESISNGSVLLVKTHEWGQHSRSLFGKAILLVRSPDYAIQAEFNRQSGGHIGFASPDRYKRTKGRLWHKFVNDKLEAWKCTNLDWLYNFTGPTHVIFYEQLVANLEHTLKTILDFLDVPIDEELFKCAIERQEGVYRRKKRVLNFDPYTEKMRAKLQEVQSKVYDAIYNYAIPSR